MSVHDNNRGAAPAPAPFSSGFAQPAADPRPYSLLNLGRVGISRNGMSENLAKAKTAIEKTIKEKMSVSEDYNLWVLGVDNSVHNHLKLPGLVFVLAPKDETQKVATFHTLIIEGPNPLPPRNVRISQNQEIASDFFSDMVYDKGYIATVTEIIRTSVGNDYRLVSVAAEVVPRTFNFDDAEAVRLLVVNAYVAIEQQMFHEQGYPEVNLAEVSRDAFLQTSVLYGQPEAISATQLPIRADLRMNVMAVSNEQASNDTVNNAKPSELLGELAGFIEPVFAPIQNPMGGFFGQPMQASQALGFYGQQQPTQKFFARLVLTRLLSMGSVSPGMQELMLAAGLNLTEGGAWWTYFRSPKGINPQGTAANRRDIGALNIEANVYNEEGGWGAPLRTGDASWDDAALGKFLMTAVAPTLAVALDVSTCSDDTYYNDVFAYAASPGADGDAARKTLLEYADFITGGRFRHHYKGNGNPVVINEEYVLNGYYHRGDGTKADVREVDYLAVMNVLGRTNPQMGAAWSDAMFSNAPREKNELAQKQIIQDVLGANVNWTGRSRRVTVMGDFMDPYRKALAEINIFFKLNNTAGQGEFFQQRGRADFLHQAAFGVTPSGVYQSSYGQPQGGNFARAFGPGARNW